TEEPVASVAVAGAADLDRVLAAAVRERNAWARTNVSKRAEILWRTAEIVAAKIPDTAKRMVREQGKSSSEAKNELERARDTFLWCAEDADALCKPVRIDNHRSPLYHPV